LDYLSAVIRTFFVLKENYWKESKLNQNVTLDNKDVQYNMKNNLNQYFSLEGSAELDDYYNYGFNTSLEEDYFCLSVTPSGGSYSDRWYIYCNKESFQEVFDETIDNGSISVKMICAIFVRFL
jgi:hypothetical protein